MKNRFYDLIEIIAHLLQAINKKVPTNLGLQQNCSVLLKMSYCIQPYLSSYNNELSITFMFQQQSKLISGFPENKAETSQKQHSCQPIKYLCLQPSCQLSRLACRQCASQCHLRHKVAIIDKLIQPLNRLSMNSYQARAQDDYNTLYSKMSEICVEWEKMQNIIIKNMLQLQDGIIFQLSTVINTFSCQEGDKAEEAMTNPATPPQLINQYVAKIHFLNKGYLSDSQTVINYADFIIARTNSTIARTTKKIDIILTKMQNRIREIDFTNIDAKAEVVQGNVVLRNIAAEGELGQPKLEAFSDSEQETEKKARVREDGQAKERRRAREGRHNKQQQSVTTRFGSGSVPRKSASSKQKINK